MEEDPPCEETYNGKDNISQVCLIKTVCIPAITSACTNFTCTGNSAFIGLYLFDLILESLARTNPTSVFLLPASGKMFPPLGSKAEAVQLLCAAYTSR